MKKLIKILLFFVLLMQVLSINTYAEWIHNEKLNGWLFIDRINNQFIKSQYIWIDNEKEKDTQSLYYFNENGFCQISTVLPDGRITNDQGQVLDENGKPMTNYKNKAKTINTTGKEIVNDTAGSNIIKSKKNNDGTIEQSSSQGTGRLIKNYITGSYGVEIIKDKYINGASKPNVIHFKENGSYISLDTKKYNKVSLKLEREKTTSDVTYELRLVVNGYEEDEIQFEDDEYELECEFEWKLNDDVDLVMYQYGEVNSYSSKGIYIINGRMAKHKEDKEE